MKIVLEKKENMKKIKIALLGIGFFAHSLSQAQQANVARSSIWQVPTVKEIKLRAEALDPKLARICSEYRDLVVSEPGQDVFDREDIDRLRGETPSVLDKIFTTKFRVSFEGINEMIKSALEEANLRFDDLRSKDLLPFYTLRLGDLASQFQPVGTVVVYWKGKSLSSISNAVGLKPMSVSALPASGSVILAIKGKDTACDLLAGDGWLEFDARTKLSPQIENIHSLEKFYEQMSDLVNLSFSKKKTAIGRASIFGYKMESLLKANSSEGSRAEEALGYYVDSFFDAEMLPNQLWQKVEAGWKVLIPQEVYSTLKVTIRR